jgi:hypothetical protein
MEHTRSDLREFPEEIRKRNPLNLRFKGGLKRKKV